MTHTPCRRCRWSHLQGMSFVRPQPWTDDDSQLVFQSCERCGAVSIQRFGGEGSSVNSVWMLEPAAMVMFRAGESPRQVLEYAFSEDFARNRGIGLGLFRGILRYLLDLSGTANELVSRLEAAREYVFAEIAIEMLTELLATYVARATVDPSERLNIVEIRPVVAVMSGRVFLERGTPQQIADLRGRALDLLETFSQPALWKCLREEQMQLMEASIDHMTMVDDSIQRLNELGQHYDARLLGAIYSEARFFQRLFHRRKARLSRAHSGAVWSLMQVMAARENLANPVLPAVPVFEALRALLEHQLVESGFLKVGQRDLRGKRRTAFQSPNTGEVLHVFMDEPRLEVFESPSSTEPLSAINSWIAATDRL